MGINIKYNGKKLNLSFENYLDESDFTQFKNIFLNQFENQKKFVMILDMTNVTGIQLSLVAEMVKLLNQQESNIKEYLIASSVITAQEWIKKIINGLFMIKKPSKPNLVTTQRNEADEFCDDYLLITK